MPALVMVLLMPFMMIGDGLILTWLWGWFIVPLFNAPPLTIAYAIGLSILAYALTSHADPAMQAESTAKTTWERFWNKLLLWFVRNMMLLIMGTITKQFI